MGVTNVDILKLDGNSITDSDGDQLLGTQAEAQADTAAATASAIGDTVSTNNGWGASSEANADKIHTNLDLLVADVAALRVTVNALLAKLRTHGIIAT
jgi:hypothetical protein